jgi:PAS domain S-box-containing protein
MKKILVIDDDDSIRANIEMILSHEFYNPILARNGLEGIELAKKEIPDLIICDVIMPGCDGFKVLASLRSYPHTSLIPFIFLTGKSERADLRKGMTLGGDDYLTKPFKMSELLEAVNIQLIKHENIVELAENAQWESEERFKSIFNYAPLGMALSNPVGEIIKANKTYCEILNYSLDEFLSMTVSKITAPEDVDEVVALNEKVKRGEIKNYTIEKRSLRKGGDKVWVSLSVSGVYKKNGELLFFISMAQDITERKKQEIESIKAERLVTIGRMAAMLTHEIKTPLTSIQMNADLLSATAAATDKNKKSVGIIKKEAKRLTNLVKDVLQFANQMDLVKSEFNLHTFFEDIAFSFESIIAPVDIRLENKVEGILFTGDYERLNSAFSGLINNSIEAVSENGVIEITSENNCLEGLLVIRIKDSGCGIKDNSKIFEPFFTTKASGTGLGLIIAQKIFQQHSGKMELKSSVPGETIFEITFLIKG